MPRRPVRAALLVAVAAFASVPAAAATQLLLNDGFDGENGGAGALLYNNFANFTVAGTVDLLRSNDYGVACAGGGGSCVDLDGAAGGRLTTRNRFTVAAGDTVTLRFDLRGNGRVGGSDPFQAGFEFNDLFSATGVQATGPAGSAYNSGIGSSTSRTIFQSLSALPSDAGFGAYTLRFTAGQAGAFRAFLGTASTDAYGPVLDNVRLTRDTIVAAVPEPATWAAMTLGFGLVGGAARRRRRGLATA